MAKAQPLKESAQSRMLKGAEETKDEVDVLKRRVNRLSRRVKILENELVAQVAALQTAIDAKTIDVNAHTITKSVLIDYMKEHNMI